MPFVENASVPVFVHACDLEKLQELLAELASPAVTKELRTCTEHTASIVHRVVDALNSLARSGVSDGSDLESGAITSKVVACQLHDAGIHSVPQPMAYHPLAMPTIMDSRPSFGSSTAGGPSGSQAERRDVLEFHAVPSTMKVSNETMLSSCLADGLLCRVPIGHVVLLFLVISLLLYFLQPTDTIQVSINHAGHQIYVEDERPNVLCYILAVVIGLSGNCLALHRMNRDLTFRAMASFESVVLLVCMLGAVCIRMYNRHKLLGSAGVYGTDWQVLDIAWIATVGLTIFLVANLDGLMASWKIKACLLATYFLGMVCFWVNARCSSLIWGEPVDCTSFDLEGISRRELYLGAIGQAAVFAFKGFLSQLCGQNFGYIHPSYVSSRFGAGYVESQMQGSETLLPVDLVTDGSLGSFQKQLLCLERASAEKQVSPATVFQQLNIVCNIAPRMCPSLSMGATQSFNLQKFSSTYSVNLGVRGSASRTNFNHLVQPVQPQQYANPQSGLASDMVKRLSQQHLIMAGDPRLPLHFSL